ncbi:unnamed protein product [Ostreobium quekettii]|uniref:EF-hand domain-containing protein n=1 Tax=Ostreobium quekettii TaxID=121088 RepID=A0A8S1J440_9CHLO|nr:unnamed protein product [Ostreobium quekettii]|eukprot:evm.model.scf_626EXC.6 EVM.evm.TU.scf_626EXC.6   scf_626EXC:44983-47858(+)
MGNCCGRGSTAVDDNFAGFDLTGTNDPKVIARETCFTEDEVYALFELFRQVSTSVVADGLIHKDEFSVAIFKTSKTNLFVERVFELFDVKKNGVVDFGEFVRSLSVFHPHAPLRDKIDFSFNIYDMKHTGVIEKDEVSHLLLALLHENPDLRLPKEAVADLVDRTFQEVDKSKSGYISKEEWHTLCSQNPTVIAYMTLSVLKELTTRFPSFVFKKQT